jgi:ubiquinone/menaquinone biosynthesis C-methylase UbiE
MQDHLTENRRHWNATADEWVAPGEANWAAVDPDWGQWGIPESEVGMLPDDLAGQDAIELGCGTGYVSGWMWRRGARVTGIDISDRQLATARRLAAGYQADIRFIETAAEEVPLPDGSFDFAVSEYGAALWAEPEAWITEAHRLLRPAGRLHFLTSTPLTALCSPLDGSSPVVTKLVRPYFGLYRLDWSEVAVDPGGIEFIPTISEWFRLFREIGFEVLDYLELQAPPQAGGTPFVVSAEWAKQWPSEHVWKLRRRP